jgi:predicted nucleotidyltransferase
MRAQFERTELERRLGEIFDNYPDVEAVYLFGSTATGRIHPGSDLDLGIVPRHPRVVDRRLDILTDLARAGYCEVDLVFITGADLVLDHEAVRLNELVYAREGFDRGEFYSKVVRRYLDFLPYLQVQREAYRRSILDG